jgi:hypothetical protein
MVVTFYFSLCSILDSLDANVFSCTGDSIICMSVMVL